MNKTTLTGRLTRDPQLHTTTNNKVATFTLAVSRRRSKSNNSNTQDADFIPVIAWGKLADVSMNYLVKGKRVLVEGRIQTRQYNANDGSKRYVTEVVAREIEFFDNKPPAPEAETLETSPEAETAFPFADSASVEEVPF